MPHFNDLSRGVAAHISLLPDVKEFRRTLHYGRTVLVYDRRKPWVA